MPVKIARVTAVGDDDRYLYVLGGYSKSLVDYSDIVDNRDAMLRYDTVRNEWDTMAPMKEARELASAVMVKKTSE